MLWHRGARNDYERKTMKERAESEAHFIRYLLGELPEQEQVRLEEVFFVDDGYFEQLLVAEDELRYEYAQGLLDTASSERFEERFASTTGGRGKLAFATELISALTQSGVERLNLKSHSTRLLFADVRPSLIEVWRRRLNARDRLTRLARPISGSLAWLQRLNLSWRVAQRLSAAANVRALSSEKASTHTSARRIRLASGTRSRRVPFFGVVLILTAALAVIIGETVGYKIQVNLLRQELSKEEGYLAQTEQERNRASAFAEQLDVERSRRLMLEEDLKKRVNQLPKWEPTAAASFILTAGSAPDSGEIKKPLIQPGEAERVRLQLNLKKAGEYQSYQALLKTSEGKLVWGQAGLRPSRLGAIRVVALILPSKIVPPGDYHVELKGVGPGNQPEEVDDYYVTVAKR